MKRFIIIIIEIFIISNEAFAMQLFKAVELGTISSLPPWGAFKIEGATYNQGKLSTESDSEYAEGVACFGNGEGALYVHYDNSYVYSEDFKLEAFHSKELAKSCRMGDKNIDNTLILPLAFPHNCNIYQINNDMDLNLYLLEYDRDTLPSYKLIGKRSDGKWLKYFETVAAEQYFGMMQAFCHNFYLEDDTIVFEYGRYDSVEKKFINYNELRFIWNNKDQWFGVEQITY